MTKKCLVLGGSGFLGSHLVKELVEQGMTVRAFDLHKPENAYSNVEYLLGDFFDSTVLDRALQGIEYVFHFLNFGNQVDTINNPKLDIERTMLGTISLLDLCVKNKVTKVIFPSSGGTVYGEIATETASEELMLNPLTPYAIGKCSIEYYLHFYAKQFGLKSIVYRLSNPFGECQHINSNQGFIPVVIYKAMKNEKITIFGNTIRDYIYVKNIVAVITNTFWQNSLFNVYNVGSGIGTSLVDLITIISEVTGLVLNVDYQPKREFDLEKIVLDISRIKNEFNYQPQYNLEEGIKLTHQHLKQSLQ